jgi:hypothetical protein
MPLEPIMAAIVEVGASTTMETYVRRVTGGTLRRDGRLTSGLKDAKRLRLAFSSSFLESALR